MKTQDIGTYDSKIEYVEIKDSKSISLSIDLCRCIN